MNTLNTFLSYCTIVTHSHDGDLLSIEQTREILNKPELSDEQLTEIRDGYRLMAEVIFDKWVEERRALNTTDAYKETSIINEHKI